MSKKEGYSREGLFGTVQHYDAKGHKIGESRPSFFGGYNNYDAKGHKVGESRPSLLGGYTNYDTKGHKTGSASPALFGGQTHYNAAGHRIGTSSPTFFGGQTHSGNFGGSFGLINNAGAAAGIHRDEQTSRTTGSTAPAAVVGGEEKRGFASHERNENDVIAARSGGETDQVIDDGDEIAQKSLPTKTIRYVIAAVPSKEANVFYQTEETDLSVGDQVADVSTGERATVLAVVDCLADSLPEEVVSAGRVGKAMPEVNVE